jgi:hypothetical protein
MTENHDIAIELKEGAEGDACQALDEVGIGAEELQPVSSFYKLSLKEADRKAVQRFLEIVSEKKLGKLISHRVTRSYAKEELDGAPWLTLRVDTTHLDNPELNYDTEKACPHCGSGAEPRPPLKFARNQMGRRLMDQTAYAGLLIMHRDLEARITGAGLTGLSFEPAVLGKEPEAFRWARVTTCLPQASPSTPFLRTGLCKRCRRGGYLLRPEQPLGLRYDDPLVLRDAADFNVTWECVFNLGSQAQALGGSRVFVISQNARKVLEEAKVAKLEYSPVIVG